MRKMVSLIVVTILMISSISMYMMVSSSKSSYSGIFEDKEMERRIQNVVSWRERSIEDTSFEGKEMEERASIKQEILRLLFIKLRPYLMVATLNITEKIFHYRNFKMNYTRIKCSRTGWAKYASKVFIPRLPLAAKEAQVRNLNFWRHLDKMKT